MLSPPGSRIAACTISPLSRAAGLHARRAGASAPLIPDEGHGCGRCGSTRSGRRRSWCCRRPARGADPRAPVLARSGAGAAPRRITATRQDLINAAPERLDDRVARKWAGSRGRERTHCEILPEDVLRRCRARQSELCSGITPSRASRRSPPTRGTGAAAAARKICARFRLDEHTRDEASSGRSPRWASRSPSRINPGRGLGRRSTPRASGTSALRHHEQASTKRSSSPRSPAPIPVGRAAHDPTRGLLRDICLNVPVEEALLWESTES